MDGGAHINEQIRCAAMAARAVLRGAGGGFRADSDPRLACSETRAFVGRDALRQGRPPLGAIRRVIPHMRGLYPRARARASGTGTSAGPCEQRSFAAPAPTRARGRSSRPVLRGVAALTRSASGGSGRVWRIAARSREVSGEGRSV
jgi:hypothetical protein